MLSHLLALLVRVLVGARGFWVGCQPAATLRIYFANHTSHLDTLALWSALPADLRAKTRPVAAKDYWSGGGIRGYIARRGFNALFIERSADKRDNIGQDRANFASKGSCTPASVKPFARNRQESQLPQGSPFAPGS